MKFLDAETKVETPVTNSVTEVSESKVLLSEYLKAGYSFIHIRTEEDKRAQDLIKKSLQEVHQDNPNSDEYWEWTSTRGIEKYETYSQDNKISSTVTPIPDTLDLMIESEVAVVCVFYNIRQFMEMPVIVQKFKDASEHARITGSTIFVVGPTFNYPPELENEITIWDLDLPTSDQFYSAYKTLTSVYADDLKDVSEDVLRTAAASAVGMTAVQGENSIALSMSKHKEIRPALIQNEKENIVKKSDVLEFVSFADGMDSVGGFEVFKDWISKRKTAYSQEAIEYGLRPPKGVLMVGIPGCTSFSSKISILRGRRKGGRSYTIQDAFYKFHNIPRGSKDGSRRSGDQYFWDKDLPTYTLSYMEDENRVGFHKIKDIVHSGFKDTYKVVLRSGRTTKTTLDHEYRTPHKDYQQLRELGPGEEVMVRRTHRYPPNSVGRNRTHRKVKVVKFHPFNRAGQSTCALSRLIVEACLNEMVLDDFITLLNTDEAKANKCIFLNPGEYEVHHIDGDPGNDVPENLQVLTTKEHLDVHSIAGNPLNFGNQLAEIDIIESVTYYAKEEVFDIVMEEPYHNFVCDNVIVHNSGKSLVAKSLSTHLQLPLIRFDIGKVFRGLQGGSEGAVRSALRTIEAVAPNVVWISNMVHVKPCELLENL